MTIPLVVQQYSQVRELVQAVQAAGVRHNQNALVDLYMAFCKLPVGMNGDRRTVVMFCENSIQPVKVHHIQGVGDDAQMPMYLVMGSFQFPEKPGLYHVKHVNFSSNGRTEVDPTEQTRFNLVHEYA